MSDDGREHQRTFATRGDAQRYLNQQLSAIQRGEWVDPRAGTERFASYAERWRTHQHVREGTASLQEQRLRLYINPVIGDLPLMAVRRSHVTEIVAAMVAAGRAPLVVKYAIDDLRRILDVAVADRLVTSNVANDRSIQVPRRERTTMVMLSPDQVAAIAARITPRYRAMVIVAAATGLRSGELRALTVDRCAPAIHIAGDVTPRQAVLTIDRQITTQHRFGPVKTSSSVREVVIGATTVAELMEHVRRFGVGDDGLIFSMPNGRPVPSPLASTEWTRAARGLDLPAGAAWHSLRHAHASSLLAAGVNIAAVSRRLGHSGPHITLSAYSHVMVGDDERILDVIERQYDAI